jgi:hypothetical protein
MHKLWGKKQILAGLIILLIISFIYAANSNNQTAVVIPAFILALMMILDTIWTIKAREYKTIYWIALSNIISIFCILSLSALLTRSKNFSDIEQMFDYMTMRTALGLGFSISLFTSSLLSSNIFKVNKDQEGHKSRDV